MEKWNCCMVVCNRVEERKVSIGCIIVFDWKCMRNSYGSFSRRFGESWWYGKIYSIVR